MNTNNNVRNILLRALFETDFHNLLLANPEKAIQDYDLTDVEKQLLIKPTAELYRYVSPVADLISTKKIFGDQPPTTTTTTTTVVAVIVVVAITVFVTAIAASKSNETLDLEKFHPLINAIKSSSGSERFDLVRTLINEITKEH